MKFVIEALNDIGIKRVCNQDSLLVKVAQTHIGDICLGVLCDGMGGLDEGELASAAVIRSFDEWFEKRLPSLIHHKFSKKRLKEEWKKIIIKENQKMQVYGAKHAMMIGTTVVVLMILGNMFYGMNVGDSRIYKLDHKIKQLTKDQTVLQYQLDMGVISKDEAEGHPGQHILMQCVGASDEILPQFIEGHIKEETVFMLASDGFVHKVSEHEIYKKLNPEQCGCSQMLKRGAEELAGLSKLRGETDNLSAVMVKVCTVY